MKTLYSIIILFICITSTYSQTVDLETKRTITLNNGWKVDLYGRANTQELRSRARAGMLSDIEAIQTASPINTINKQYYYVPPASSLRILKDNEGKPTFGYYMYLSDFNKQAQGALLNFHVTFGLNKEQEAELQQELNRQVPGAQILGSVALKPYPGTDNGAFTITTSSLGEIQNIALSKAPLAQGEVAALSAALSDIEAQKFAAMLKSEISAKDVFFNLNYTFPCAIQAAAGSIVIHQERFQNMMDNMDYAITRGGSEIPIFYNGRYVTEEGLRHIFNTGLEENIIEVAFLDNTNGEDENVKEIIAAFFNFFKSSTDFFQRVPFQQIDLPKDSFPDGPNVPYYEVNKTLMSSDTFVSNTTTNLSYRVTLPMGMQISGGLSDWMSEYDLESLMMDIQLDDEKWTSKNIVVQLSADIQPLLSQGEINAVEVAFRKKRGDKYYRFADQGGAIVFTANTISNPNGKWSRQFSRIGPESDIYEYKTTWKFKGAVKEESEWITTSEESIVLECPLTTKNIDFSIPIDDMNEYGINMAAIEIRYIKAKKERTKSLVVPLGKNLVNDAKSIVMDAGVESYATRYIFNVKGREYLMPWQDARSSTGYYFFDIQKAVEMINNQDFGEQSKHTDLLNELGYLK